MTTRNRDNKDLLKVVMIRWEDASFSAATFAMGESPGTITCITVGILVAQNEKTYTLAFEISPKENTERHVTVIPKAWVTKYVVLSYLAPEKKPK